MSIEAGWLNGLIWSLSSSYTDTQTTQMAHAGEDAACVAGGLCSRNRWWQQARVPWRKRCPLNGGICKWPGRDTCYSQLSQELLSTESRERDEGRGEGGGFVHSRHRVGLTISETRWTR
jgi:hypothetical protein